MRIGRISNGILATVALILAGTVPSAAEKRWEQMEFRIVNNLSVSITGQIPGSKSVNLQPGYLKSFWVSPQYDTTKWSLLTYEVEIVDQADSGKRYCSFSTEIEYQPSSGWSCTPSTSTQAWNKAKCKSSRLSSSGQPCFFSFEAKKK
jgi:hypothetical protein